MAPVQIAEQMPVFRIKHESYSSDQVTVTSHTAMIILKDISSISRNVRLTEVCDVIVPFPGWLCG